MPFYPKHVRNVAAILALGGIAGAAVIKSPGQVRVITTKNGKAKER